MNKKYLLPLSSLLVLGLGVTSISSDNSLPQVVYAQTEQAPTDVKTMVDELIESQPINMKQAESIGPEKLVNIYNDQLSRMVERGNPSKDDLYQAMYDQIASEFPEFNLPVDQAKEEYLTLQESLMKLTSYKAQEINLLGAGELMGLYHGALEANNQDQDIALEAVKPAIDEAMVEDANSQSSNVFEASDLDDQLGVSVNEARETSVSEDEASETAGGTESSLDPESESESSKDKAEISQWLIGNTPTTPDQAEQLNQLASESLEAIDITQDPKLIFSDLLNKYPDVFKSEIDRIKAGLMDNGLSEEEVATAISSEELLWLDLEVFQTNGNVEDFAQLASRVKEFLPEEESEGASSGTSEAALSGEEGAQVASNESQTSDSDLDDTVNSRETTAVDMTGQADESVESASEDHANGSESAGTEASSEASSLESNEENLGELREYFLEYTPMTQAQIDQVSDQDLLSLRESNDPKNLFKQVFESHPEIFTDEINRMKAALADQELNTDELSQTMSDEDLLWEEFAVFQEQGQVEDFAALADKLRTDYNLSDPNKEKLESLEGTLLAKTSMTQEEFDALPQEGLLTLDESMDPAAIYKAAFDLKPDVFTDKIQRLKAGLEIQGIPKEDLEEVISDADLLLAEGQVFNETGRSEDMVTLAERIQADYDLPNVNQEKLDRLEAIYLDTTLMTQEEFNALPQDGLLTVDENLNSNDLLKMAYDLDPKVFAARLQTYKDKLVDQGIPTKDLEKAISDDDLLLAANRVFNETGQTEDYAALAEGLRADFTLPESINESEESSESSGDEDSDISLSQVKEDLINQTPMTSDQLDQFDDAILTDHIDEGRDMDNLPEYIYNGLIASRPEVFDEEYQGIYKDLVDNHHIDPESLKSLSPADLLWADFKVYQENNQENMGQLAQTLVNNYNVTLTGTEEAESKENASQESESRQNKTVIDSVSTESTASGQEGEAGSNTELSPGQGYESNEVDSIVSDSSSQAEKEVTKTSSKEEKDLPGTGEGSSILPILGGLLSIAAALWLFLRGRKH